MASCTSVPTITGGAVSNPIASGTYPHTTLVVYTCNTGYVMTGSSYITCNSGTWSTPYPTCTLQTSNDIDITNNENDSLPTWLLVLLAVMIGFLILLIFACVVFWCGQMCGFYDRSCLWGKSGSGSGSSARCRCCCTKSDRYDPPKTCKNLPRHYQIDEYGRRYHLDDYGRRCYTEHKNKTTNFIANGEVSPQPQATTLSEPTPRVQAKELLSWKPHANPVRSINTSTK
ncbi:uncharacterized protein LOC127830998 [Dreissena polymorpha]|uniref:Sushi domain-containing protein n=1 Tax=Dreissena polymorpha TaxID=45954 RepID=A0A9D4GP13_DREPO|nr:uncharacterized protein LOC127830998 [Dreissena polymorpha]XP_052211928.1 uncharacterized protein LOC127830998 [Dreissena polymorpha]XP_052211929.1 uncharacterized protein LOC127830998 [Dreissena polymorpha]XP_052211930.1 uncharacterized protein LOC127830998 [Dreissena polymorpha]XP_052211931.1 uncharacterized protein LOC127830998 [Dreissena polymorpha]KAH3818745.1 hypothetical protein DPMN_120470 [Dreissena polymorpha]